MTNFPDFLKLSKASRGLAFAIPSDDVLFKIETFDIIICFASSSHL
jgi:hypothetical protein